MMGLDEGVASSISQDLGKNLLRVRTTAASCSQRIIDADREALDVEWRLWFEAWDTHAPVNAIFLSMHNAMLKIQAIFASEPP